MPLRFIGSRECSGLLVRLKIVREITGSGQIVSTAVAKVRDWGCCGVVVIIAASQSCKGLSLLSWLRLAGTSRVRMGKERFSSIFCFFLLSFSFRFSQIRTRNSPVAWFPETDLLSGRCSTGWVCRGLCFNASMRNS